LKQRPFVCKLDGGEKPLVGLGSSRDSRIASSG
jgi:hypothetical protein